jgi:hypothetical protein
LTDEEPVGDGDRLKLREALELLQADETPLHARQVQHLQEMHARVIGTDFASRLRYWVGRWTIGQSGLTQEEPGPHALAGLVVEALADPSLLERELAWMYSDEAFHAGLFADQLGERDHDSYWQVRLFANARHGQGAGFLALYLRGRKRHDAGFNLDALLDGWSQEDPDLSLTVLETTARREPTDAGARRLLDLVDRGWLPPAALSSISWGTWPATIDIKIVCALLERLCHNDDDRCSAFALGMLYQRLEAHPEDRDELAQLALPLLAHLREVEDGLTMLRWNRIASLYALTEPKTLAQEIVRWLAERRMGFTFTGQDAERLEVLTRTAQAIPEEVWSCLAPLLEDAQWPLYSDLRELTSVLAALPVDLLLTWAANDYPHRALLLARIAPTGEQAVTGLARSLLIRFSPDNGLGLALAPHRQAAAFYGSYTSYLDDHLRRAEAWTRDTDPIIARWARQLTVWIRAEMTNWEGM